MKSILPAAICLLSVSAQAMDCDEYQHQVDMIAAEREQNSAVSLSNVKHCIETNPIRSDPVGATIPEWDKCQTAADRANRYNWGVYNKKIAALNKKHPEAKHCQLE